MADDTPIRSGSRAAETTRLSLPIPLSPSTKRRVDLVLASIAGALAVLVGITARGAIVPHAGDVATPPPTVAPLASASPTPAQAAPKKDHGDRERD